MINQNVTLEELTEQSKNTLDEHLGIKLVELGEDFIKGTMPVDQRTHQPMGLLHGGASVVLAESLGSIGANLCIDTSKYYCVGLDINANHLKGVREGLVTGVARPIHLGKKTHVWEIKIENSLGQLICISRLTMAVISRK